ncbi:MAG TPA: helix-turn-helix domain-containing protein [Planctomycetaceae bacterium]
MPSPDLAGDAGRYLTVDELAARNGVPKSLIYKLKADGLIPYVQRCRNGKLRFRADALDHALIRPDAIRPAAAGPAASEPPPPGTAPEPRKRLSGRRPKWQDGT